MRYIFINSDIHAVNNYNFSLYNSENLLYNYYSSSKLQIKEAYHMKHHLRLIPTLLVISGLVACGQEVTSTETDEVATDTSDTVTERRPYIDKADYNGERFTILAPEWGLYNNYFFADEQTGDAMNDAIFDRELLVEDYLGVDIGYILEGTIQDIGTKVSSMVMSGDTTYQLVLTHCIRNTSNLMSQNMVCDWNTLPSVDLTREYWNQSCNENLSLYGKQYFAVSDYMIADPNAIFFNKDMITSYNLDDPYELVRSGKWTLDKLMEMASTVTNDVNGDGVFDVNDQYGFGCEGDWMMASFFYSSGIHFTDKTSDGGLELTLNSDRTYTLIEKLDTLFNKSGDAFIWPFEAADENAVKISTGRVLFQVEALNNLYKYRDTTVNFGIIPYPMLDETQNQYVTNDWSGLMCVPTTAGDLEMIGKVCEMLAYYSSDTTIPAYYNLLLGDKFARDEDSKEMLELIFDGVVYDAGMNFFGLDGSMNQLFYTCSSLIYKQASGDFASWYNSREEAAMTQIEELLSQIRE